MVFLSSSTDYAVSGNCLFFKSSKDTPLYAILPEFTNNISDLMLTFTYRNEGTNASNGTLYVSYMTDPTDASTFDTEHAITCDKTITKTEKEVFFENAPAGSYIAFKYQGGSSNNYYLSIDNVSVEPTPTCNKPSGLTKDATTAHTATLHWTKGESTQDAWQIAYSTTADFDPNSVTPVDVTTNPATIEGLTQSTTYYAYVRTNCGDGDYSTWCTNNVTFSTVAGNVTPTGLAVEASTITSSQATASWNAVAGNTLHQSYDIYWAESTVTAVPEEPASPNLIAGITATSQDITGLTAETAYKVWVRDNCGTDGYSNWSSAVTFTTASACQTPDGLAESEVTSTSAKITWNTYGQTAFNLRYSSDGGTSWTTVENVNSPYTFPNNLAANTAYQVQVQASCNTTEWSTALNFRTDCDVMTITTTNYINEDFEDYTATVFNVNGMVPYCWDSYSTGTSYPYPHVVSGNSYNYTHSGNYSLNFIGEENKVAYVALPEFTNDLNTLMVNFWMKTEGTSDYKLSLGYITSEDDNYSTYQVIEEYDNTTTVTERTTYLGLKNVPSTATRLVFRWNHPTTSWHACCIDDVVVKLAPSCFPVGTLSAATEITSSSAKLSWTLVDNDQDEWQVCINDDMDHLRIATIHENFLLDGLEPVTDYTVKVRANCGSSQGEWSNEVNFTTLEACSVMDVTIENITHHNVTVNWNGESEDDFTVYYRTAAHIDGISEEFSETSIPTGWSTYTGLLSGNTATLTSSSYIWSFGTSNGVFDSHARVNIYNNNQRWLVTPSIASLAANSSLSFDLALTAFSGTLGAPQTTGTDDKFIVLISTDNKTTWTTLREWNNSGSTYVYNDITCSATGEKVDIDLSSYSGQTVYIAFYGESTESNADNNIHIDNVTIGVPVAAGDYQTQLVEGNTTNITSLTAGTKYEVRVVPNCNPSLGTEWTSFTTMSNDVTYFTTTGDWATASNWMDEVMPTATSTATIQADANVTTDDAIAKNVLLEGTSVITVKNNGALTINGTVSNIGDGSIIVEDGGQLIHNNQLNATIKKSITAYTAKDSNGWYLIATPAYNTATSVVAQGTYDLFKYNEPAAYWYSNTGTTSPFNTLDRNTGYLYANAADIDLSFDGSLQGTNNEVSVNLSYTSTLTDDVRGFNLLGNPFTRNLVIGDMSIGSTPVTTIYVIKDEDRTKLTAVTTDEYEIKPCEGFFVQATATSQSLTLNPAAKDEFEFRYIKIVAGNENGSDNAYIQLENGNTLSKMNIANKTSVSVIDNGEDFAAATIYELAGSMPVNFKAVEDGNYTITVNAKNIEPNTMILVDAFTGEEVNLLETPNYSFKATTNDEENRFKIIFDCNTYTGIEENFTNEIFAYQYGSEIMVNGEGELQVFDVMGRIVLSTRINGVERINVPANAVYIFKLNEKVQKIVVR